MPNAEPLFDVVIYEISTRKIDAIVGKNLRRSTGFYNAEHRQMTALQWINDHYNVAIVDAGKYRKGDFLELESDEGES